MNKIWRITGVSCIGVGFFAFIIGDVAGESQPLNIGSARIILRPPTGYSESSGATPFLTRYFSALLASNQFLLGGYLTEKDLAAARSGAEPALAELAIAYGVEQQRNETITESQFSQARRYYRAHITEAVASSADKTRAAVESHGGTENGVVSSEGVFRDDSSSFAYLVKTTEDRTRFHAIALLFVRGKIVNLMINKVYSGEADSTLVKKALNDWIDHIRADNP